MEENTTEKCMWLYIYLIVYEYDIRFIKKYDVFRQLLVYYFISF